MTKLGEIEEKLNDHTTDIALLKQSFSSMHSKIDDIKGMIVTISQSFIPLKKTGLQKWGETARNLRDIVIAVSVVLLLGTVLVKSQWLGLILK